MAAGYVGLGPHQADGSEADPVVAGTGDDRGSLPIAPKKMRPNNSDASWMSFLFNTVFSAQCDQSL